MAVPSELDRLTGNPNSIAQALYSPIARMDGASCGNDLIFVEKPDGFAKILS